MDSSRSIALLGESAFERLSQMKIAIIGVGGVGSWCAEALVRTGATNLTLVDDDVVVESNINRQCPALASTMGRPKVEAMRERLLAINPEAAIEARNERFTSYAQLGRFDVIVDAIDSVDCKAELILGATADGVQIVSSMGAALRTDPTKVEIRRFDKVEGDGLARALRQRFKKAGRFPASKFNCVVSTELPREMVVSGMKGSIMPVTASFGMALASEVIRVARGEGL